MKEINFNQVADENRQICDEDVLLMQEVAKGSEHAFRMIVEKWKNPLVNFFYRHIGNLATSEDLAQNTFINLYKVRDSYQPSAKFSSYIFKIARNLLINEYRRAFRKPAGVELNEELDGGSATNSDLELSELEEVFEQAISTLPENQKTAILLLKQQDLSYEEIAEAMDASVGAVKTWIFRAREVIKSEFERILK